MKNGLTPCDEPFPSGDGADGEWRTAGGHAHGRISVSAGSIIEPAPVPSYIRARLTRAYLALADATRPCPSRGASQTCQRAGDELILRLRHVSHMHDSIQKLPISPLGDETIARFSASARTHVDVLTLVRRKLAISAFCPCRTLPQICPVI